MQRQHRAGTYIDRFIYPVERRQKTNELKHLMKTLRSNGYAQNLISNFFKEQSRDVTPIPQNWSKCFSNRKRKNLCKGNVVLPYIKGLSLWHDKKSRHHGDQQTAEINSLHVWD